MEFSKSWFSFCDSGLDWLPAELWLAPGSVAVWLLLTEDAMWGGGWRFRGWTQRERGREREDRNLPRGINIPQPLYGYHFSTHNTTLSNNQPLENEINLRTWFEKRIFLFRSNMCSVPAFIDPMNTSPPPSSSIPLQYRVRGGYGWRGGGEPRGQYYQ